MVGDRMVMLERRIGLRPNAGETKKGFRMPENIPIRNPRRTSAIENQIVIHAEMAFFWGNVRRISRGKQRERFVFSLTLQKRVAGRRFQ